MSPLKKMLFIILAVPLALGLALVLYFMTATRIGGTPSGERLERIHASPHQVDGRFRNVVPTSMDMSFGRMVTALWEVVKGGEGREPVDTIPTEPFDAVAWSQVPDSVLAICWFGHSSLLIKLNGLTFLLDPVFSERASTFSFVGPKRFNYSEHMRADQLPHVDVVLLSHDHYDHLDHLVVQQLKDRPFIVPLGVGAHLERWDVPAGSITEKDWWEEVQVGPVRLTLTPSRHFSGRGLTNRFTTLWGAWVLQGPSKRVFFGADSGYSPTFKEVGERFGPFDLALLECGAYNERWPDIHMLPEETVQAALDVRARMLMPIHWGKFNLAMHPWKEPVERAMKAAEERGMPLLTPRIGRIVTGPDLAMSESWWSSIR